MLASYFIHTCRIGEACSHIAAVISCLVRAADLQARSGVTACTSQKFSWLPVARDVSINFVSVISACKCWLLRIQPGCTCWYCRYWLHLKAFFNSFCQPSKKGSWWMLSHLLGLSSMHFMKCCSSSVKPAILKITPPYSKQFIPRLSLTSLPTPIYHSCIIQMPLGWITLNCSVDVKR